MGGGRGGSCGRCVLFFVLGLGESSGSEGTSGNSGVVVAVAVVAAAVAAAAVEGRGSTGKTMVAYCRCTNPMSSKVLNDVASHRKLCGRVEMATDGIFVRGFVFWQK